jgi:hypothetical protein
MKLRNVWTFYMLKVMITNDLERFQTKSHNIKGRLDFLHLATSAAPPPPPFSPKEKRQKKGQL